MELIRKSIEARAHDKDLKLDGAFLLGANRIIAGMVALHGGPAMEAARTTIASNGEKDMSSYRTASATFQINLVPVLMHHPIAGGLWLLHCKDGDTCSNVAIDIKKEAVIVHDGEKAYLFSLNAFIALLENATDRWGFAWFLQPAGAAGDLDETKGLSDTLDALLDLHVY